MDLRGLESTQWRGFSDREIQHYHSNIKKESKTKLEAKGNALRTEHQAVATREDGGINVGVDPLKDDLHCGASSPQPSNATIDDEAKVKEVATPLPLETPSETDLTQPYVNTSLMCECI